MSKTLTKPAAKAEMNGHPANGSSKKSERLPVMKTYKIFIGGKFPRTESGRYYQPAGSDGKPLANVCRSSRKDVRDAVVAARGAVERRLFLTDGSEKGGNIDPKFVATAMRFVPTDAPLYSIGPADAAAIDDAFAKTIFDRRRAAAETVPVTDNSIYGDQFEMRIDEEPAVEAPPAPEFVQPISSLFAKARTIVSFSRPKMLESPLFFETDRALIVIMKSSGDLDAALFEKLISDRFAKERAVGADRFKWRSDDGWRVLDLPFLGSGIRYRVDGRNLIVTNRSRF